MTEFNKVAEPKSGIKKWAPLFVMGLAIIIIVLDTTLLNVALGTLVRDLDTNIQSLQWVITTYALTLAALTITGGRFGDLFGRKKMFIIGAIIFAIGSFIASISQNVGTLIIGESVIEGIGAALMMPATSSLLVSSYRGRDRALALGVWGGMAAVGSAIGPVVGGYLTSHYSWRWGFRINVFVVILLLAGSYLIKEARDKKLKPTIDWVGVILSSLGMISVIFGLIESSTYGWFTAKQAFLINGYSLGLGRLSVVPIALIVGFILLGAFYFWERKVALGKLTPLVSMKIFANKQFTSGALLTSVMSIGQVGMIFGLPIFLQGVRGFDALHTGYALLPMSIGLLIMAPLGGYLAKHFKPKHIVQVGLFINILGLILLRQVLSVTAGSSHLIIPLFIYGMGMGLAFSQLSNITLSAVSVNESGEASGVNSTFRQIGSSLGTAIIGSILIASISSGLVSGVNNSNQLTSEHKKVLAEAVQAQASDIEFGVPLKSDRISSQEIATLKHISDKSTVKANKQALLFTAVITTAAFLLAAQLPNVELSELEIGDNVATKAAGAGH